MELLTNPLSLLVLLPAAAGLLLRTPRLTPITTAQFRSPAPRPAYSAMATQRYTALTDATMRPWREALHAYLHDKIRAQ